MINLYNVIKEEAKKQNIYNWRFWIRKNKLIILSNKSGTRY